MGTLAMQRYGNRSGRSGVVAFGLQPGGIAVEFVGGDTYLYTDASAGRQNVAEMRRLAGEGVGLSSFISRTVRDRYAKKLR